MQRAAKERYIKPLMREPTGNFSLQELQDIILIFLSRITKPGMRAEKAAK
jgi:hypothetical protein